MLVQNLMFNCAVLALLLFTTPAFASDIVNDWSTHAARDRTIRRLEAELPQERQDSYSRAVLMLALRKASKSTNLDQAIRDLGKLHLSQDQFFDFAASEIDGKTVDAVIAEGDAIDESFK